MLPRILDNVQDGDKVVAEKAEGSRYDEYDGSCETAVPIVTDTDALLVLLLQIFVPGVGAFIAAYRAIDGFNYTCCGHGIGQMLTGWLGVGFIWSLIQGIFIFTRTNDYWAAKNGPLTVTVSGSDDASSSGRLLETKKQQ